MNPTKLITTLGKLFFLFKNKDLSHHYIQNPKKILVIRSGAIGDVIMTTPLLKSLRKHYPSAEIIYLVGDWSKKIIAGNKNLDRIISFPDSVIYQKDIKGTLNLIRQLRKEKIDLAFILDKSYHWSVLAYLSNIKRRIGFNRTGPNGDEGFANNLNINFDGSKNELDYYLDLAKIVGIKVQTEDEKTEIFLSEKDELFAQEFAEKNKLSPKTIGLVPGGAKNPGQELDLKRWPVEHFITLIKLLLKNQPNSNLILFGGPGDKEVSERIHSALQEQKINTKNIIDIIGKTSLHETAALMRKCQIIVTPDSGPLHIAATGQAKVVALFGPTPAHRFAPKSALIFQNKPSSKPINSCPCYDVYGNYKKCTSPTCMNSITPEQIYNKIAEIL